MVLLRPSALVVHQREVEQQAALEFGRLPGCQRCSTAYFGKNLHQVALRVIGRYEAPQTVIGEPAAHPVEKVVTDMQCIEQFLVSTDAHIGSGFEPVQVSVIGFGVGTRRCLVGPPGRQDFGPETAFGDTAVIFERIDRIVGRTDHLDITARH